jgi:hypothetical protein
MAPPRRKQSISSSSRVSWSQVIPADGATSEQQASVAQGGPAVMTGWEVWESRASQTGRSGISSRSREPLSCGPEFSKGVTTAERTVQSGSGHRRGNAT